MNYRGTIGFDRVNQLFLMAIFYIAMFVYQRFPHGFSWGRYDGFCQVARLLVVTCMMGDFYKRQLTAQQWLCSHGISEDGAGDAGGVDKTRGCWH